MKKYDKEKIYNLLNEKNINYKIQKHNAVYTMADLENSKIKTNEIILKNLFLKDSKEKHHFLVCIKGNQKIDLKKLQTSLSVKHLSFASKEELEKYLGVESGCVSPFNILNDINKEVNVIFDKNITDDEIIGIHPNDNKETVYLEFKNIKEIIKNNGNALILKDLNEGLK